MKHSLTEIIIVQLLYLTPIGYALSLLSLQLGERTPGVYIDIPRDMPMTVHIKANPLLVDRTQWLFTGAFLLGQALYVLWQRLGGVFGMAYAWIALVFGLVSVVSFVSPTFPWNKRFKITRISILEILVVLALVVSLALTSDIF